MNYRSKSAFELKGWQKFQLQLDEIKKRNLLTSQDVMFVGEEEAQRQCDTFAITMYQRMEMIAKTFNTFL